MEEAARTTMERLRVEQAGSEYYHAQEKHAEDVARTEARRESDRKKAYEEGKKNYERYLAQEQQKREEEKQHKKEEERAKRQAEQAAAAKEEADKEQQKVKEAQQAKHEDQLQKAEDDILGHSADADAKREQKKDELAKLKEEEERILGIGKKSSFLQGHDDDDEDAEDKEGEENKGKGSGRETGKAMTEAEEDAWSRSRLDKLRRLQHRRSQKVSEEDRREGEMKQAEYEAETTMARLKVAQEASEWEQAQRKHEEDVQKTEERKARDNKAKYEEGKRNYEKYLAVEEKKKQDAKVAEKLAQKQKIEEDLKAQEAKRQADLKAMEERILGKAEADIDALKNELKNGRAPKEVQDVGHSLVSAFENSFRNFYRGIAKPEDAIEEHA